MTRVVGVSRILNEVDLIEPFLRHHAALLDHHIVLDNGSDDGTVEVMRALREEGLSLEVYQAQSALFLEQAYNTGLYRLALAAGADWVVFLDADELLVVRGAGRPGAVLELVPEGVLSVRMLAFDYARPAPGPGEHPFEALRMRMAVAAMPKLAMRRADPGRIGISAGNHFALVDGREEASLPQDRLYVAHMPDRSPLQLARRAVGLQLKVIASGAEAEARFNTHRAADLHALIAAPRRWLQERAAGRAGEVEERVRYLGGVLRYTAAAADDLAQLLGSFSGQGELLARTLGEIVDRKRLIRQELQARGSRAVRLF